MKVCKPDAWTLLRVSHKDMFKKDCYKVFGSWRGNGDSSDEWRLSSGASVHEGVLNSVSMLDADEVGSIEYHQDNGSAYHLLLNGYEQHTEYGCKELGKIVSGAGELSHRLKLYRVILATNEHGGVELPLRIVGEQLLA